MPHSVFKRWLSGPLCVIALGALGISAMACDTPVYRFSMYSDSWAPWPYAAFYLHSGEIPEAHAAINRRLASFEDEIPHRTNLVLHEVNTTEAGVWEQLPKTLRQEWEDLAEKGPRWFIMAPHALRPLYSGNLDDATLASLIDSPVRQQIGKAQEQGKMVLLLLEGAAADENEAAAKVIADVAKQAADGLLASNELPLDLPKVPDPEAKPNLDTLSLELQMIRVRRDDPAERFLVQMLMAVEPDLDRFADRAMVFLAYGRGRVLPPYIGAGITAENLITESGVQFLLGPCSCEIKGQNPGADLLTSWDWRASAMKLAEKFGEEEGNQDLLGISSLVPTLSLGMPGEKSTPSQAVDAAGSDAEKSTSDKSLLAAAVPAGTNPPTDTSSYREAAAGDVERRDADANALNRSMSLYLGIGIAAAALIMVVFGLIAWRGKAV